MDTAEEQLVLRTVGFIEVDGWQGGIIILTNKRLAICWDKR